MAAQAPHSAARGRSTGSGRGEAQRSAVAEQEESAARMKRRRACLELGQRKEDFELLGLLGQGSYAHVYKARSRHSGRQVAIKVIDKTLIATCPGLAERVRAEAETHILLDHAAVVRLHTFFEDSSSVYFVMDLCEGGELYHYIRSRGGGLPEAEARRLFTQVLAGLRYLHAHHIAHRDLKLSNLLLTSDLHVKISDFGLSVVLEGKNGESGTMCGTPNYMSPEVISSEPHGLTSDVWSLGCLLYTMLVGVPPFESHTVEETLRRIACVKYSVPDHVSPAAADLISQLLVRDPSSRISLDAIMQLPFMTDPSAVGPCARAGTCANAGTRTDATKESSKSTQVRTGTLDKQSAVAHRGSGDPTELPSPTCLFRATGKPEQQSGGDVQSPLFQGCRDSTSSRDLNVHEAAHRRNHAGVGNQDTEGMGGWTRRGIAGRAWSSPRSSGSNVTSTCTSNATCTSSRTLRSSSPSPHMSSGKALRDRLKSGCSVEAVGGGGFAFWVEAEAVASARRSCGGPGAGVLPSGTGDHEDVSMRSSSVSMCGRSCWQEAGAGQSFSPPLPYPAPPAPAPPPILPAELRLSLADASERKKEAEWEDDMGLERGQVARGLARKVARRGKQDSEYSHGADGNEQGNTGEISERGRGREDGRWVVNDACPSQRSSELKSKSFSSALLSARSHVVATPVSSARSSIFGGGGAGEGADRGDGRDSSIRRSAQYTRPSTPSHPCTPKRRDKRDKETDTRNGDALEVVDTWRMKPNTYETKVARLSIDSQGAVLVESKHDSSSLLILAGGMSVHTSRRCVGATTGTEDSQVTHDDAHAHLGQEERHIESLRKPWRQLYQYACKMIKLIQSKTPLIVYYSPLARARLMNDGRSGAPASFECDFYSGGHVARKGKGPGDVGRVRDELVLASSSLAPDPKSGLVVMSGGPGGEDENNLLQHASACLQQCTRAVDSLFGCARTGQGRAGEGAGVDYPVVMAHKDAMHRIKEQPPPCPSPSPSLVAQKEHQHRHQHQHEHEQASTATRDLKSTAPFWLESSAPSAHGGSDMYSRASQQSRASQYSRASRASTVPSSSQYAHPRANAAATCFKDQDPRQAEAKESSVRGHERKPLTQSAAAASSPDAMDRSMVQKEMKLELGADGRVFEFSESAGWPVVHKTAFFKGFGWVLCLQDGSLWGQLLDGSQIDCQAVVVAAHGDRRVIKVQNGLVQDDGTGVPEYTVRITEQLLLLRGVL